MPLEEALRILGLAPGESVENHQRAFEEVRSHLTRMRDEAPTPEKRETCGLEIERFEEALRIASAQSETTPVATAVVKPKKKKFFLAALAALLILGALLVAGVIFGSIFFKDQKTRLDAEKKLPAAEKAVEGRDWDDAEKIYASILKKSPNSKKAKEGLEYVRSEKEVERMMQVRFALGKVQGLMDIQRWEEAEVAMQDVLKMEPDDAQLQAFASQMQAKKRLDEINRLTGEIKQAKREEQWQEVVDKTNRLAELQPDHENLPDLRVDMKEAQLVLSGFRKKADELYDKAIALDEGKYSDEALQLLREAQQLAPSDKAANLYEKMSAYVQTVKVPSQAATIAEALSLTRAGDRVILAPGTYQESLLIPAGVSIESESEKKDKTIIAVPAGEGSVIVVMGSGAPVRLVGLTIRHSGVSAEKQRYPIVLANDGAQLMMQDCDVSYSAGHGVAVLGGARCALSSCEVRGCGWDGVFVRGAGSEASLQDTQLKSNLHHGLDVWEGGQVWVKRSRFQNNGLTGIFLGSQDQQCRIESSTIEGNREVGLMATAGVKVDLKATMLAKNSLGGVYVDGVGTVASLTSNSILKNGEVGLVVSKEATLGANEDNNIADNDGRQIWLDVDLEKIKKERKELSFGEM